VTPFLNPTTTSGGSDIRAKRRTRTRATARARAMYRSAITAQDYLGGESIHPAWWSDRPSHQAAMSNDSHRHGLGVALTFKAEEASGPALQGSERSTVLAGMPWRIRPHIRGIDRSLRAILRGSPSSV
jgi:hypothetical protein